MNHHETDKLKTTTYIHISINIVCNLQRCVPWSTNSAICFDEM